ncbi:amidohydrolase, partial [Campylobacter jejuni]|nr:amidohydrolase [Campylobacter jejuni]
MKIDTHAHIFLKKLNTVANTRYKPDYDA